MDAANKLYLTIRYAPNFLGNKIFRLPFIFLSINNYCNSQCIMCNIWKSPQKLELSVIEIENVLKALSRYGTRTIVITGGEPLAHPDIIKILRLIKGHKLHSVLCTNGVLLKELSKEISSLIDKLAVSFDGDTAHIHNAIRGVDCFEKILDGIERIRNQNSKVKINLRSTIQKENFFLLPKIIKAAKLSKAGSITFSPIRIYPEAFGHTEDKLYLGLGEKDLERFKIIINETMKLYAGNFKSRFISTDPARLRQLYDYFLALLGKTKPRFPKCILPRVSLVVEPTGEVLPCFFKPAIGNLRQKSLQEILSSRDYSKLFFNPEARQACRNCSVDFWTD